MTYFNLRKRGVAPETETVEADDEHAEVEAPDGPDGPVDALWAGISGPGRWLTARSRPGLAWLLYAGSAWAIWFYGGWISIGIVLVWLLAALAFIPREHLDRLSAALERRGRRPAADAPETADEAPVSPLVTLMWQLIGEAPGVHVKTLAEVLQAAAPGEVVDRAAVRTKLGALGIPVKASVRDAAGRVNEGVHSADLEAWQEALPGPSQGAAPGPRSGHVATAVTCDVGDAPTAVATPLSRLRRVLSRGAA